MSVEVDEVAAGLLTPEEREALNDDALTDDQRTALQEIAGEEGGDDDGDGDDGGDDGEEGEDGGDAASAEKPPEAAAAETPPAAADAGAGAQPQFQPAYQFEIPADFEDRLKALQTNTAGLKEQLKAGEIDVDQYSEKMEELALERDALNAIRIQADISSGMQSQTAEQRWQWEIGNFMSQTAKDGGIDYRKDEAMAKELDRQIRALASDADNNDKPMRWFLDEANAFVRYKHGLPKSPVANTDKPAPDKPDNKPAPRKPPTAALPKTLADVPGSGGPGDVSGEFADLDNLDGDDLEDAIARMSPAQRERYAAIR